MGCSKSSSKRKFYSNTILPQETRKTSNRQPKLTPKAAEKRTKHPKISRRKEIIIIWAEINGKGMKETVEWRLIKLKAGSLRLTDKPLARLNKKKKGEESNQQN